MPNDVEIVVTGRDAGATKVLDDVTASSRATEKAQQKAAEASKLAADVMKEAGGTVRAESVRMVQAKLAERKAAEDLARVQADARKGYLDEANAARVTAAAMENLARAKMQVATINAAPPPKPMSLIQAGEALEKRELGKQIGSGDFLRERMNEHLGEFGISESMGGLTAGVAAASVVVGELANKMREAVSESLEFGEAMSRAAAKTGLSVETLSVLHYAAAVTGGDFEGMSSAVAKMDKTIAAATEGNKRAQAFVRALGLDAKDLASRADGTEVAFQKFAATLAATENPVRRVELATGLLGKTGADQIPTLIELGNRMEEFRRGADETGTLLTGKTAEAFARTQDTLHKLEQASFGAGLALTEGLEPALDRLLNAMSLSSGDMDAFKTLGQDIGRIFEYAGAKIADAASAAFAFDSAIHGAMFTDSGRTLLEESNKMDVLAQRLKYEAMPDWMKKMLPNVPADQSGPAQRAAAAYKAGLGNQPGPVDPLLQAIRTRNASRAEGFGGVGDLSGGNPDQKRLKAMEGALNEEKIQFGMSVKAEYDYWTARQNAFVQGSDQYETILSKRTALAMEGAAKDAEVIRRFKAQQAALSREQAPEDKAGPAMARQDAQAQESRYDTSNELYAIQQRMQMQLAEMAVHQQVGRTITEEAGAMQVAAIHTAAYGAELERLEAKRKAIADNPLLSSGEADQQRKVDELNQRIATLQAGRQIEIAQDAYAVKNADQSAVKGATDALNNFRLEAMDTARQMHELTTAIMNSVHAQILNAVTGQKTNFRGVGEQAARGVADMGLKKLETNAMDAAKPLLDKFGLGGLFAKKRDGSSASAALFVQLAGAAALPGTGGSDDLSKVLSLGLPGMPEYKDKDQSGGALATVGKLFGLGGGKGDGSSPSSPLYVKDVGGAGGDSGGLGSLGKLFGGGGDSSDGSGGDSGGGFDFSSLGKLFGGGGDSGGGSGGDGGGGFDFSSLAGMMTALPGFADGVDDFSGGPALVGERGPEVVDLPRGASVVPNHKAFGGGGDTNHTWNIDARGAHDPVAVEMAVQRGISAAAPHIAAAGARAAMEGKARRPSTARSF